MPGLSPLVRYMKKIAPLNFTTGQVWQVGDSQYRIGMVGKRLVHYKHVSPKIKRSNALLSTKAALEKFLQENNAVLVPDGDSESKPQRKGVRSPARVDRDK